MDKIEKIRGVVHFHDNNGAEGVFDAAADNDLELDVCPI